MFINKDSLCEVTQQTALGQQFMEKHSRMVLTELSTLGRLKFCENVLMAKYHVTKTCKMRMNT